VIFIIHYSIDYDYLTNKVGAVMELVFKNMSIVLRFLIKNSAFES